MDTMLQPKIKKMSPQLLVTDLERAVEFYTKVLGFEVAFRYEDFYAGIVKDGCSVHLKRGRPSGEERKSRRANQDLDINFSVDGIEVLYAEMLHQPVDIVQPLRAMPYGREFYIADPDGYMIGFLEEK